MGSLGKEILLGTGLGELFFGMSRIDVKKVLGDPDEIENYEYVEGEMAESWHYDKEEISLTFFEKEADWQMETIAISSDTYTLEDVAFVGMSEQEAVDHIKRLDLGGYSVEQIENDAKQSLIKIPTQNLFFWLDDGTIAEIQWEPLWEVD